MSERAQSQTKADAKTAATSAHAREPERNERSMFQHAAVNTWTKSAALSSVQQMLASPGRPLDATMRAFAESRFGHDFSNVRVHTDDAAANSAREINARAYTSGSHIVFGAGQYTPRTSHGQSLLAHELAHVVQQARFQQAPPRPLRDVFISHPSDHTERAAHRAATQVLAAEHSALPQMTLPASEGAIIQRDPVPGAPVQTPTRQQEPTNAQGADQSAPSRAPDADWELVQNIVRPELGFKFWELSRVIAVDAKQQIYDLFKSYDDSLTASDLFKTIMGVIADAGGNVSGDPNSAPGSTDRFTFSGNAGASLFGGIGGALSGIVTALFNATLSTDNVGEVKEQAQLEVDNLIAEDLTTDSDYYNEFESSAMEEIRGSVDAFWHMMSDAPALYHRFITTELLRDVSREYGVHGNRGGAVVERLSRQITELLNSRIRPELERLRREADSRRLRNWTLGFGSLGLLAGGTAGLALYGSVGPWGLLGLAAGGAAVGAAVGAISAVLTGSKQPTQRLRTAADRAADRRNREPRGHRDDS